MKKLKKVKENAPSLWHIPPLNAADNKYTRGHVVMLGGEEMTGAIRLSALAAQRVGAGMVTIAATPKSWAVYAASMLSVITRSCDSKAWVALMADARACAALIGPGAGLNARTKSAMIAAAKANKPLVLDADALALLASDATLRKALMPVPKILTPHLGEAGRLAQTMRIKATGATLAAALATAYQAVVVLKGSETYIADEAGNLLVTHPPAWLATAGTGDILAGMIAALVGQGMSLFDAASAGVWLHAQAAQKHGRGMIAEDIIASVPTILNRMK